MGEFVGVDPTRLQELTRRLERLHTVLAQHAPAVRQKMQKWDSDLDFGPLPRLIGQALDDVRDMEARVSRAHELAREKGWTPFGGAPGSALLPFEQTPPPTVQLDWATTGQSGYQAKQDVKALAAALATKDPEQARIGMSLLPDHLARHLDDKAYLAAFWAEAGPAALQAARVLLNRKGMTLFSADSASILRALGASLAAATRMHRGTGKDSRPLLSDEARAAITKSSDPWSAGMLFKYGPDGKAWDSHFLADVTRSMLAARAAGKIEIPTPAWASNDALETATRYAGAPKLWAEFDPVIAVMDRASQNGQAARHVLGDPSSGFTYAKMLVNDDWLTKGSSTAPFARFARGSVPETLNDQVDLSSHVGDFLKAAVSAPRGSSKDANESAWSVINIVRATSDFSKLHPGTVLPHDIRRSLIFTTDRYLPDFAAGATKAYGSGVVPMGEAKGNPWIAVIDGRELSTFFDQALHDPKEFGAFKGMLDARISTAVAATVKDSSDANYLAEMARLYGLIERIERDRNFAEGQLKDEQAARNQTALAALTGGFGALSFQNAWGPGVITQFLTGSATPYASEMFDTDNALKALKENADAFREQVFHVEIPVIQGLINAGVLHPPKDATWVRNGRLAPDPAFTAWLSQHAETEYGGRKLTEWVTEAQQAMRLQQ
ncbi:hypothetical protein [Sphaerisporangium fuscum]|uniref:hypothetical protein n=1 Tax=Sphaerisporangium fuscum TaxID=2835868 RepID=UPI001BDD20EE|nr:hypothetical protein [Sphaerisporangium fuscum]